MRIAYLGAKGLPSKGGTERVLEALVQRLVGRHEITVYCDARYTPAGTTISGVRLVRVPTIAGKHVQAPWLFVMSALHALLFGHYDLVHVHGVEACFVLPFLRFRYRVLATAHGSPTRSPRAKWGAVARTLMALTEYPYLFLPNCATTVSQVDAQHCAGKYGRTPIYIPNGVDELPLSTPEEDTRVLAELDLQSGSYLLFAAGRIDPTKGCHLVLEAFSRLALDVKLVIAGDLNQIPAYGQALRKMADDRVRFVPLITSKKRLMSIVRHCGLFVFPSLTEGMSMMLLEVASLGIPMVCSDIPENKAVLGDRAVYFGSKDAGDLAEKIEWALDHRDVVNNLALEAQRRVRQEFSWDRIVTGYEAEYARVVGSDSSRPDDAVFPASDRGAAA